MTKLYWILITFLIFSLSYANIIPANVTDNEEIDGIVKNNRLHAFPLLQHTFDLRNKIHLSLNFIEQTHLTQNNQQYITLNPQLIEHRFKDKIVYQFLNPGEMRTSFHKQQATVTSKTHFKKQERDIVKNVNDQESISLGKILFNSATFTTDLTLNKGSLTIENSLYRFFLKNLEINYIGHLFYTTINRFFLPSLMGNVAFKADEIEIIFNQNNAQSAKFMLNAHNVTSQEDTTEHFYKNIKLDQQFDTTSFQRELNLSDIRNLKTALSYGDISVKESYENIKPPSISTFLKLITYPLAIDYLKTTRGIKSGEALWYKKQNRTLSSSLIKEDTHYSLSIVATSRDNFKASFNLKIDFNNRLSPPFSTFAFIRFLQTPLVENQKYLTPIKRLKAQLTISRDYFDDYASAGSEDLMIDLNRAWFNLFGILSMASTVNFLSITNSEEIVSDITYEDNLWHINGVEYTTDTLMIKQ